MGALLAARAGLRHGDLHPPPGPQRGPSDPRQQAHRPRRASSANRLSPSTFPSYNDLSGPVDRWNFGFQNYFPITTTTTLMAQLVTHDDGRQRTKFDWHFHLRQVIVDNLVAHYRPRQRPRLRTYQPPPGKTLLHEPQLHRHRDPVRRTQFLHRALHLVLPSFQPAGLFGPFGRAPPARIRPPGERLDRGRDQRPCPGGLPDRQGLFSPARRSWEN